MSKPTLEIFTGDKTLGSIFREQIQINVKFAEFTLAFSNTTGNTAANVGGKIRVIMLQGAHDGTGFTGDTPEDKLGQFIYEMDDWVTGRNENLNIQAHIVYTDSFGETYTVYCVDWMWTRSITDPNRILYTLILKEA